jgi:hypothetical protein
LSDAFFAALKDIQDDVAEQADIWFATVQLKVEREQELTHSMEATI